MSSKIKVDTIENVAGSGNVSLGSGHNLVVPGNITGQGTAAITSNATVGGTLGVTGETTLATHLNMGDNDKIKLGASADLQVYHDGSNSFIDDGGTGNLFLRGESQVIIGNMTGEQAAVFNDDGAVTLNHDNSQKFSTTSSGVTVTGNVGATTATIAGDITQTTGDFVYSGGGNFDIKHNTASQNILFHTTPSGGTATERVRIDSTGRVGIFETSPQAGIHITSTNNDLSKIRLGYSSTNHYLEIGRQAGFYRIASFENGQELTFGTSTTPGSTFERARFLGAGSHSGHLKVSDNSTYRGASSAYHEIRHSGSGTLGLLVNTHHASYAGDHYQAIATRAASGATYTFMQCFSGDAADREYRIDSDGSVHSDGAYSSSGADYAEMFEWKDGNTSSEDRVGKTVVLDGNQIRLSTSDDAPATIIGVVSARPVVLGDAQDEKWKDKYETDSYGRYVFEEYTQTEWTIEVDKGAKETKTYQTDMIPSDVTVPDDAKVTSKDENGDNLKRRKLNTAYDESKTYEFNYLF